MSAAKPAVTVDFKHVSRAAARAVATYERHDALQREIEARLFESLDYFERSPDYKGPPARVLDIGCGTGRGTALLKKRWPKAIVIALDIALPMLREVRRHSGWLHPLARVAGDARTLPFADHSLDVVYSNFCLPWIEPPKILLKEFRRVLTPGGFVVASSLGPDTLGELRAAWAAADPGGSHVGHFADMHDVGDATLAAGLKDPVLDTDRITTGYTDARGLLADLKGAGATNADAARPRGLTGKARFARMLQHYPLRADGRAVATWEVVTLHAWGPPKGFLPRFGGRETPFEVIEWAPPPKRRR